MYRIHPDSDHQNRCVGFSKGFENVLLNSSGSSSPSDEYVLLTVWKRSSMTFQGTDGFTVIDSSGRLAFRVDNYTRKACRGGGGGVVLMDGHGKPLLTLKPQVCTKPHAVADLEIYYNFFKISGILRLFRGIKVIP